MIIHKDYLTSEIKSWISKFKIGVRFKFKYSSGDGETPGLIVSKEPYFNKTLGVFVIICNNVDVIPWHITNQHRKPIYNVIFDDNS